MSALREVTEADLHAYADGLATPARRLVVDAWLVERPQEQQRIDGWQSRSLRLRQAFDATLHMAVPHDLAIAPMARQRRPDRGLQPRDVPLVFGLGLVMGASIATLSFIAFGLSR